MMDDRKEDQYFNVLAEYSNELIFILDKYGSFKYINQYFEKVLNYSRNELTGKHFYEIISEGEKISTGDALNKMITEKVPKSFCTQIIPKVGIDQSFEIRLVPVFENGELKELVGIGSNLMDQIEQKNKNIELEEQLKEANRLNIIERDRAKQQINVLSELNNLKNEFISNVSHELRTPLASIIGFSETILEDSAINPEIHAEFNKIILTESKRLAKLIDDVLDFSELENEKKKLHKTTVDIILMLKELIDQFSDECKNKKIILTSNIPESVINIYADQDRLQKAFSYLMSNACKFTNENGRIAVIAQEFLREVEIIISDTGIGIDRQKLPLLFDKFSKIKRIGTKNLPGAGFGLVTVKQIIDLHKGLIRVRSEVDKGTSFIVRLPKYSLN